MAIAFAILFIIAVVLLVLATHTGAIWQGRCIEAQKLLQRREEEHKLELIIIRSHVRNMEKALKEDFQFTDEQWERFLKDMEKDNDDDNS